MADEKQSDEAAPRAGAKSNTLLIAIIAVLATLLIGGGVAAFFLMRGGNASHDEEEAASEAAAPKSEDKKKGGEAKGKKEAGPKGPAIYVEMEPPFVVNFESAQSVRFLQVSVQAMTRDPETAQLLKDNEPLVRNNVLMLLANQTYETLSTGDGKEALRKQATDTVRAVIKQEGGKADRLEAVYFTSFVMQ